MAKLKYGSPGLAPVPTRVGSSEVHGFSQASIYVMCVQSSHTPRAAKVAQLGPERLYIERVRILSMHVGVW